MIQITLWLISFISLYLTIVWLHFIYLDTSPQKKSIQKNLPFMSILVPAYNEEKTVTTTIDSLTKLRYPKEKIEIIVINDGSTDQTQQKVEEFIKQREHTEKTKTKEKNIVIRLLNQKNKGKAAALNFALKKIKSDYFAVVDADSTVDKYALTPMVSHFKDKNIGAVISIIKVRNPQNIYSRMQRIEYAISAFTRMLMAKVNTLAITPGVLSVYKKRVVQKIGGFAEGNMTEDFEIAMRLKYYGYNIIYENKSITYTNVPTTFTSLKRQRIRWFRGFISNHMTYKSMFFNKQYKTFGIFQLPLNVLGVLILLVSSGIFLITGLFNFIEFLTRSYVINNYFFAYVFTFPSLKELFLGQDLQIVIPITIASVLGIYFLYLAHKEVKEKLIKFPFSIWMYFVIFPYITTFHWIEAIAQEVLRIKKKW